MKFTDEEIAEIKARTDLVALIGERVELRRQGKDFSGLCPFHPEKTPSFTVSPGKQLYYCFGCGASGDAISWVEKMVGMSFADAVSHLADACGVAPSGNGRPPRRKAATPGTSANPPRRAAASDGIHAGTPPAALSDKGLWRKKATAFMRWAHERLEEDKSRRAWLNGRGIRIATARRWMLGWNPGRDGKDLFRPREAWGLKTEMKNGRKKKLWIPRGLVIPLLDGHPDAPAAARLRVRTRSGKPKYYVIPGSRMSPLVCPGDTRAVVVVESELDAILLWQEAGGMAVYMAMGSSRAKPDEAAHRVLREAAVVLVALDYDAAGALAMGWWRDTYGARPWLVPDGKDPGDAYKAGVDLAEWIKAGLPAGWRIGQSVSGRKKEGGADLKCRHDGRVPEGVRELARLLRGTPVRILNRPERTAVLSTEQWRRKNWDTAGRVSELLFGDPEVLRWLDRLPPGELRAEDILDERF